ncbi:MAG: 50S ribosomal protein L11 methyltransferase [Calothrix sp. C42_A2020_038]|nr:50S ribosomal protein L11 methyltransferase [Calothrix sp. C42_A2020_038]
MSWIELTLNTTSEAVDWVCTLLAGCEYTSDVTVNKSIHLDHSASHNNWIHTINFYLPNDIQASTRITEIEDLLSPLYRTRLTSTVEAYIVPKKSHQLHTSNEPIKIGEKFVVLSPNCSYLPKSDEIIIELKTSLAFGSGLHPATVLAIKLLERYLIKDMNVLDLGCGSGILSVAAAKLGANVLAVDNDIIAVKSTQDAVTRNAVTHQVEVMQASLGRGSKMGNWMGGNNIGKVTNILPNNSFDLIVANILGRIHTTLAPDYQQALSSKNTYSGILITSGYDQDYEVSVIKAFQAEGFQVIDCQRCNEWVALAHRLV